LDRLPEQRLDVVAFVLAVQQRIADVFEQRLEQDRLLIAERRFDGPVPVFAGVVVVADRDERKRRVDPVAVDLLEPLGVVERDQRTVTAWLVGANIDG